MVGVQPDISVIGSGPNGLAAAVALADESLTVRIYEAADTIGGGTRTKELTLPGFRHDVCSTSHPFGIASPYFSSLDLGSHGLEWVHAEVPFAHAISPGWSAYGHRSLEDTADGLGTDGDRWRDLFGPIVSAWDEIAPRFLAPMVRIPNQAMIRFGTRAILPATLLAQRFETEEAKALFLGAAAHSFQPLTRPVTGGMGLAMVASAHVHGWPFAIGGSQSIADALASRLADSGGEIVTGTRITTLDELPRSRAILADTTPSMVADLLTDRVPERFIRPYRRFRHGPSAYKIDYALSEPVPWADPDLHRTGLIHLGGTAREVTMAEGHTSQGHAAKKPFTLIAQPAVDPGRAPEGRHTLWVYAHVPTGSETEHIVDIERWIEQFAPGFSETVLGKHVMTPRDLAEYNPNYVDGDIGGGSVDLRQLLFRPKLTRDPYRTPLDRVFLCSASTPPGPGVHGMSGYWAAQSVLRRLGG